MNRWRCIGSAAMAIALATTPVIAQETSRPKALSITATIVTSDGGPAARQVDSDSAALYPGDVVHYRLVFTNVVDVPVQNVEFTDRIPAGLIYVAGSGASDGHDVVIEYSIDGGSTYSGTPVVKTTVNGETVRQPAPPESYTHIRWRVNDLIQPRAQVTAEFRAQLATGTQSHTRGSSTGRDE